MNFIKISIYAVLLMMCFEVEANSTQRCIKMFTKSNKNKNDFHLNDFKFHKNSLLFPGSVDISKRSKINGYYFLRGKNIYFFPRPKHKKLKKFKSFMLVDKKLKIPVVFKESTLQKGDVVTKSWEISRISKIKKPYKKIYLNRLRKRNSEIKPGLEQVFNLVINNLQNGYGKQGFINNKINKQIQAIDNLNSELVKVINKMADRGEFKIQNIELNIKKLKNEVENIQEKIDRNFKHVSWVIDNDDWDQLTDKEFIKIKNSKNLLPVLIEQIENKKRDLAFWESKLKYSELEKVQRGQLLALLNYIPDFVKDFFKKDELVDSKIDRPQYLNQFKNLKKDLKKISLSLYIKKSFQHWQQSAKDLLIARVELMNLKFQKENTHFGIDYNSVQAKLKEKISKSCKFALGSFNKAARSIASKEE